MRKKIMKVSVVIFSCIMLFIFVERIYNYKFDDGITGIEQFYELEKDTVDVLVLGSSHAFCDVNPAVLYREYGIAAYVLGGSMQPMWNTYYYLEEALKYQTPQVVVLDVFTASSTYDYMDLGNVIKNTFGLKYSQTKIDAIQESAEVEYQLPLLLEWPFWHNRWSELSEQDFEAYKGIKNREFYKGYNELTNTWDQIPLDVSEIEDIEKLTEKNEEFLKDIITLCKDNDIKLLLICSPFPAIHDAYQKKFNAVGRIADELDIPYINFNSMKYSDIGLDVNSDIADTDHLNYKGAVKYSSYLGKYILDNYNLPDRRKDTRYVSWKENMEDNYRRMDNYRIKEIDNFSDYLSAVSQKGYTIVLSADGLYKRWEEFAPESNFEEDILELGIKKEEFKMGGIWIISDAGVEYCSTKEGCYDRQIILGNNVISLNSKLNVEENVVNDIVWNRKNIKKVEHGLNLLIYDDYSKEIVECVGIDLTQGLMVIR